VGGGGEGGGGRKGAPQWGWAPFTAARGSGRRQRGSVEMVGGETTAPRPWARARHWRPLSESGRCGLGAVSPRNWHSGPMGF
jgi:hypothetical protein